MRDISSYRGLGRAARADSGLAPTTIPISLNHPKKQSIITLPPDVMHFGRLYEFVWSIVTAFDRVKENIESF